MELVLEQENSKMADSQINNSQIRLPNVIGESKLNENVVDIENNQQCIELPVSAPVARDSCLHSAEVDTE